MGRYAKENNFVMDGPWIIGDNAILNPAAFSTDQDDYDPTGWRSSGIVQVMALGLSSTGGNSITGLAAPSPAARNMVYVQNVGTGTITLQANNANSVAANRFDFNGNTILQGMEGVWIVYNTTLSRWTEIARAI